MDTEHNRNHTRGRAQCTGLGKLNWDIEDKEGKINERQGTVDKEEYLGK